jgi:hypothetical protein
VPDAADRLPHAAATVPVGGRARELAAVDRRMRCTGDAYVQKLVLVGDGRGLVVNSSPNPTSTRTRRTRSSRSSSPT